MPKVTLCRWAALLWPTCNVGYVSMCVCALDVGGFSSAANAYEIEKVEQHFQLESLTPLQQLFRIRIRIR